MLDSPLDDPASPDRFSTTSWNIVRRGWQQLSARFPGATTAVLLVVYVAGLWPCFSGNGSGGPRFSRVQYEIGAPTPWFEFVAGELDGFEHDYERRFGSQIHFLSPAWLTAATAFAALYLYHRLRLRRGEKIGRWDRPRTHAVVWLIVAAIGTSLCPAAMLIRFASRG